jgi:hypothetical protein
MCIVLLFPEPNESVNLKKTYQELGFRLQIFDRAISLGDFQAHLLQKVKDLSQTMFAIHANRVASRYGRRLAFFLNFGLVVVVRWYIGTLYGSRSSCSSSSWCWQRRLQDRLLQCVRCHLRIGLSLLRCRRVHDRLCLLHDVSRRCHHRHHGRVLVGSRSASRST